MPGGSARVRAHEVGAQVVVLAGGQGKRFGRPDIPKALLPVGDGTLLDHLIDVFAENGFREFVLLVGHRHEKIESHLGDGSDRGVEVRYSIDPRSIGGVGKGKALKHALASGAVDRRRLALIAHPDDILLDRRLPARLLTRHSSAASESGALATIVVTNGFRVPYGVVEALDDRGMAMRFEEKPFVRLLISTGLCALSPGALTMVDEVVDMEARGAVEYETVLYTRLAAERRLATITVPPDEWVSVNDLKEYEQALARLTRPSGTAADTVAGGRREAASGRAR